MEATMTSLENLITSIPEKHYSNPEEVPTADVREDVSELDDLLAESLTLVKAPSHRI